MVFWSLNPGVYISNFPEFRMSFYFYALYLNNYVFVEEYFAILIGIIAAATFNPVISLVLFLSVLLILSPRFSLDGKEQEVEPEPTNVTRPHTGAFSVSDQGLVDALGRRVFLRGVNVNGKQPLNHTTSDQPARKGSFVGSLFQLNSIDLHLRRLASCGYTMLRLNVTWEALEPIEQGYYDLSYIEYLVTVVRTCNRYGMWVIIDSHQDVWSRWTGGDGAPRWTMERLGMDPDVFPHTRSALTQGRMMWFTNSTLYGAGTMFALFFGGNRFAPATRVNGMGVQDWLQSAYIKAWCKVAEALANEKNVLGFEPMNEPNAGWIGLSRLDRLPPKPLIGWALTPWDSIRLANGNSFDVASFNFVNAYSGSQRANMDRRSVWKSRCVDVWKENGVWGPGLIKPEHFKLKDGESFEADFLAPFQRRFAGAILHFNPRWWIVCYPKVDGIPTAIASPHWYDGLTLIMNRYIPYIVLSNSQSFVYPGYAPYAHRKSLEHLIPGTGKFFLGEVGIPWLGTVKRTARALESTMAAVDSRFVPAVTLWNYNPHHTPEKGDGWNLEDFSIWSPLLNFRMPNAVRPYVMILAGKPVSVCWEPFSLAKTFTLAFEESESRSNISLIFVPAMHYGAGVSVWTNDGGEVLYDKEQQIVEYRHCKGAGKVMKMIKIQVV